MTALAVAAGAVCGVLSGFGIGGGSLLMVWMTAVLSLPQRTAQTINLLFFLPAAASSLVFHIRGKQVCRKAAVPAVLAGSAAAAAAALLAHGLDSSVLRKIFGAFLLLVGLSELFRRKK